MHYEQLRTTAGTRYDFSEAELNRLGYTLLDKQRNGDAIRVFEVNVRQFPTSSNAFDSLGDALYGAAGGLKPHKLTLVHSNSIRVTQTHERSC